MVHCFTPEARVLYNLEGLWTTVRDPFLALARADDGVDHADAELVAASRAWESYPRRVVKTKYITEEDLMVEDDVADLLSKQRS